MVVLVVEKTEAAQQAFQRAAAEVSTRTPLLVSQGVRYRPKLLDLFCGAGGAGMGLYLAGFDVSGCDMNDAALAQYPFPCTKGDALQVSLEKYDVVWASPPCLAFSGIIPQHLREKYAEKWAERHKPLIAPIRERLDQARVPYIIENVVGASAELRSPARLDGTMFDLAVFRPRLFETNWTLEVDRRADWRNKALGIHAPTAYKGGGCSVRSAKERLVGPAGIPKEGWRTEEITRKTGETRGRVDLYYYEISTKKRFRSVVEVERYIGSRVPVPPASPASPPDTTDAETVAGMTRTFEEEKEEDKEKEGGDGEDGEDVRENGVIVKENQNETGVKEMFAVYGQPGQRGSVADWRRAMGIEWMTAKPLAQSIPPAMSEYLGRRLLRNLGYVVDYAPVSYAPRPGKNAHDE